MPLSLSQRISMKGLRQALTRSKVSSVEQLSITRCCNWEWFCSWTLRIFRSMVPEELNVAVMMEKSMIFNADIPDHDIIVVPNPSCDADATSDLMSETLR